MPHAALRIRVLFNPFMLFMVSSSCCSVQVHPLQSLDALHGKESLKRNRECDPYYIRTLVWFAENRQTVSSGHIAKRPQQCFSRLLLGYLLKGEK